ncbi:CRP-like cAMP-activated global transcriptional regulator [bacterium HR39]|nr:CRP-like cAMP-activated global transcriptional regulator [bacterium HR39]
MAEEARREEEPPAFARRLGLGPHGLAVLRRVPLFENLPDRELALLLADAHLRRAERGSVLFLQGEPAERLFVVLEGWVRLWRSTARGQDVTIHIFGPGESIGEAVVFLGTDYPVTAEVVADARLLVLQRATFLDRLHRHSELCFRVMASMAMRLQRFVRQVEQLAARSTVERLAAFLLRLAAVRSGSATVELPHDKVLVAARLGMQPETLSRAFARLRAHGVEVHGHRVVIRDVERLMELLGDDV